MEFRLKKEAIDNLDKAGVVGMAYTSPLKGEAEFPACESESRHQHQYDFPG